MVGREQFLRVMRDAVHHRLQVERRRDVASHFRQRRAFARAALRLVEEARGFQRDAHRRRDGLQEAHFGGAVCMLALVVLEQDARPARGRCR